ncbi:MurR/RpiR family transcriptional regulator [Anderseniella sp. Alg231-50]|uniref:MurR/RpiR family transcriptional regulator n=1 Tax=Anderseniella sp. Alg231-50 TaxID=1922226 RepID=UPI00307B38E5
MTEFEQVQDKLTRISPKLPPQLRKAAAFLLENPGEIATQSMRKISTASGVTLSNYARLAKVVGYEKYNDLRDVYRRQVHLKTSDRYPERADRLQSSGKISGDEGVWSSFKQSALKNVEAAYSQVDVRLVASVAERLLERDQIYISGMQASSPLIDYFHYVGGMAVPKFKLLGRRGGIIADDLVDLNEQDALLCLAIQPCARTTIEVAELAYQRGVYVVGITDSRISPLAAYSTDILLTSCDSPLFFESYVGVTAILELLVGFMTTRAGPDAVKRIRQIEADRQRMGEYWDTGKGGRQT